MISARYFNIFAALWLLLPSGEGRSDFERLYSNVKGSANSQSALHLKNGALSGQSRGNGRYPSNPSLAPTQNRNSNQRSVPARSIRPPVINWQPLIDTLTSAASPTAGPAVQGTRALITLFERMNQEGRKPIPRPEMPEPVEMPQSNPANISGSGGGSGGSGGDGGGGNGGANGNGNHSNPWANPLNWPQLLNELQNPGELGRVDGDGNPMGPGRQIDKDSFPDQPIGEGNMSEPGPPQAGSENMIGANTNDNVGWMYQVYEGGGRWAGCQAALVSRKNGVCVAATAAHCIASAVDVSPKKGRGAGGSYSGVVKMNSPNFGTVEAIAHVNPYYQSNGVGGDSGALVYKCDEENPKTKEVEVLELSSGKINPGTEVRFGKVMQMKGWGGPGAYTGFVADVTGSRISVNQSGAGAQIEQGDSGGPLWVEQGDKKYLVGMLNSYNSNQSYISNYAAGSQVRFVQQIVESVNPAGGDDEAEGSLADANKPEEGQS